MSPHARSRAGQVILHRLGARNTRWTFEPDAVREYVESRLAGRVLNVYAGRTELRHDGPAVRVDNDPDLAADHHVDAIEVGELFDPESFDTVVLDPPYSERKAHEKYGENSYRGRFAQVLDVVAPLVRIGGRTIVTGYQSGHLGKSRGFRLDEVALVYHPGDVNDTIIAVEERVQCELGRFGGRP